jgi:hypothetical protein
VRVLLTQLSRLLRLVRPSSGYFQCPAEKSLLGGVPRGGILPLWKEYRLAFKSKIGLGV